MLCPVLGPADEKECRETGEGYQIDLESREHNYKQTLGELVVFNLA